MREGGREWDTVKPLALHNLDLSQTVLVDNEGHKAYEAEGRNMVVLPEWRGQEGESALRPRVTEGVALLQTSGGRLLQWSLLWFLSFVQCTAADCK